MSFKILLMGLSKFEIVRFSYGLLPSVNVDNHREGSPSKFQY